MMPIYDCGEQDCEECQKAFGPDRSKAIAEYKSRAVLYEEIASKNRTNKEDISSRGAQ